MGNPLKQERHKLETLLPSHLHALNGYLCFLAPPGPPFLDAELAGLFLLKRACEDCLAAVQGGRCGSFDFPHLAPHHHTSCGVGHDNLRCTQAC